MKRTGVTSNGEAAASIGEDANLLMLVQIPLRYRQPKRRHAAMMKAADAVGGLASAGPSVSAKPPSPERARRRERSDVEMAVLGHGPELGPYTELDGLTIERDPRFPVRVTIQFYQATSNGIVSAANVATLANQIRRVYQSADYVGSLVTPHGGEPHRATAWQGTSPPLPGSDGPTSPAWSSGRTTWAHPAPGRPAPGGCRSRPHPPRAREPNR